MERMPDYVMRDLVAKMINDACDVVMRSTSLVPHPLDKFTICTQAAFMVTQMMIAAATISVPHMQGEYARTFCMKKLNERLAQDDAFVTDTIEQVRKEFKL